MVKRKKKALYTLLWLTLLLALASLGAWIISAHFPGRSFASAFGYSCLVALLMSGIIALFNIIEGCVVAFCPLILCLLSIPLLARVHSDTVAYIVLNGIITGFISGRALHRLL